MSRSRRFTRRRFRRFPFRSRAFLKIQEGCNNFCSYCIVPYARGPERSRSFDEVLADCRQAVAAGYPELVLTGVNTCAYFDAGRDLGALVREVCRIDGNFRVRLSSTEPHPHNIGLLEVMASEPKVCRFLHLALQNGCNRILKAMNRHYRREDYAEFARIAPRKNSGDPPRQRPDPRLPRRNGGGFRGRARLCGANGVRQSAYFHLFAALGNARRVTSGQDSAGGCEAPLPEAERGRGSIAPEIRRIAARAGAAGDL